MIKIDKEESMFDILEEERRGDGRALPSPARGAVTKKNGKRVFPWRILWSVEWWITKSVQYALDGAGMGGV